MKRGILLLVLVFLLFPIISADILIKQQPDDVYNLGDVVKFPLKILSSKDINSFLSISLICSDFDSEVHKEFISLDAGDEISLSPKIPLISDFVNSSDICKAKIIFGSDYVLSKQFKVSDKLSLLVENYSQEFYPEQEIILQGEVKKETGDLIDSGFIELNLNHTNASNSIKLSDTIENGLFFINYTLPKDVPSGEYKGELSVYQKDIDNIKINSGVKKISFSVKQVPTDLELSIENDKINPNEKLRVKPILKDQTGKEIKKGNVIVTIKDNNRILRQAEGDLGTYFEYEFDYDYAPSKKGSVFAISNRLSSEKDFEVLKYKKVDVEIVNNTLILENKGNVLYNDSVLVQIGEETLEVNTSLEVNEIKKYSLSAPNGDYDVEITAGDNKETRSVALTGNAISVREFASSSGATIAKKIFIWLFIILVIGFFAYVVFREFHNQNSFLRKRRHRNNKVSSKQTISKDNDTKTFIVNKKKLKEEESALSLINPLNKGIFFSSISGEKQKSSLICINLKNLNELKSDSKDDSGKESITDVLNKIVQLAESNKSFTYVNDNYIFFIFPPSLTKTFENEKKAIEIGNKIKSMLDNHNKFFKNKIDYGISLNTGEIVMNKTKEGIKFMSIGSFLVNSKKISCISSKNVLIGKEMNEKIISYAKTDKNQSSDGKIEYYKIREMRDKERHKKFIGDFVKRMEGNKNKDNNKKSNN